MSYNTLTIVLYILLAAGALFAVHNIYFAVIALLGQKKKETFSSANAETRFAVLIAARNEAAVIGQLVESLKHQNYPKDKYDIIVAPNNCTDDTAAVAIHHGAKIFNPAGTIRSKGEVLTQIIDQLAKADNYDAICVFDADNLVDANFLQSMNNARLSGAKAAQGLRDSKNPSDTAISTCYSVCYWMLNQFYNSARERLGLSALINGSGFMVDMGLLRELGGWHTTTMIEDYEFSAQCVLHGQKVHYVRNAVIYDEQPLTFHQSWKQRRRWSTGNVQSMEAYCIPLFKDAIKNRNKVSFDMALTFVMPFTQLVSLLVGGATFLLSTYLFAVQNPVYAVLSLFVTAIGALLGVLGCSLFAAFIIQLNKKSLPQGTGRGILYFTVFLLSWMVINILSIFKRQHTWVPIVHTRSVHIKELETKICA